MRIKGYILFVNKIRKIPFRIILGFAIGIPLLISLDKVVTGNIPFWYDNARDLLSAWGNLNKPTLIGPTSGIPGIFYGPYWIWFLSIGLLFSKDPRIANLGVGIFPYFIVFPFVLFQFAKLFNKYVLILIWLLFIFSTGIGYATSMWNPNLAPVLFLVLVYLLVLTDYTKKGIRNYAKLSMGGFVAGLIINFHISFGIGVFLGVLLFLITNTSLLYHTNKNQRKDILSLNILFLFFFVIGLIFSFIPTLLFEYRHGFHQTKTAITAFTKYGAVVTVKGLSKGQILQLFFGRLSILLHINAFLAYILQVLVAIYVSLTIKYKKLLLDRNEIKLIIFLITASAGILFIYLSARNPVWDYHFIGTEIIFLLLVGLIINKIPILKNVLTLWIIILLVSESISFINSLYINPYTNSSLFTKEYIVDTIARNANHTFYTVYDYSPSIYQYDYAYLFKWRANKDVPYDPSDNTASSLVFLIFPVISPSDKAGYINYRTPNSNYKTTKIWHIPDGSTIVKRERKK